MTAVRARRATARRCGVVGDVTTADGRARPWSMAPSRAFGGVDVVVNNVGGSGARDSRDADDADLRRCSTATCAGVALSRAALPHMRARGGGSIVMIASI